MFTSLKVRQTVEVEQVFEESEKQFNIDGSESEIEEVIETESV